MLIYIIEALGSNFTAPLAFVSKKFFNFEQFFKKIFVFYFKNYQLCAIQ